MIDSDLLHPFSSQDSNKTPNSMLADNQTTHATPTLPPSGKYFVKFKDHRAMDEYLKRKSSGLIMHQYKSFDSIAGKFDEETLERLRQHPDIVTVEPDKFVGIDTIQ